jgi:HlyD family secretion protein
MSEQTSLAKRMRLPILRGRSDLVGDVVGAFESDTVAVFLRTAPVHKSLILYTLTGLLTVAILFCALVKIDRVVVSQEGWIFATAGPIYVSPFDMGIVKDVLVKVGDTVKKGQSLATLDPTFTMADLVQLKEHYSSDDAQITREKAELARKPYVYDPKDHFQKMQGDLWRQRQGEFKSTVDNYEGQIKSAEAQLAQARSDVEKYTIRLKIADDVDDMYKPLVEKGYVANLQLLQSTDADTEINRLLNDAKNEVPQYAETAAALRAQLAAYIQTWDAATSTQLVADENDLAVTRDSLDKAQKMQDLTSLDAPEDAIVTKVGQVSKGSVQGGASSLPSNLQQDPLITLAPLNAPMEAELDVSTQDVGFVRVGDPVTLEIDAFPYVRYGTAMGQVRVISETSYSVDQNGLPVPPFFKVRVVVKALNFRNVPKDARLVPGMTGTGDIEVGQRTILSYLTEPIEKNALEAMREP